ncbi:MAG: translation initiation factor IF-2, partial [bacterium]|nr:translation initiation factor IF-2 [bacterium]
LKLSTEKVKVTVIHAAVGGITESDVSLAHASNAVIIGFNVRPDTKSRALAENEQIEIKTYSIIYEVVDEVKKAMEGLLAPTYKEQYLGRAEVRQVFTVSKIGAIAGCMIVDGKVTRAAEVRLLRNGQILYQGKIHSLKRFKDDAKEVTQGSECGIGIENYNDLKPGDLIEAFLLEKIAATL